MDKNKAIQLLERLQDPEPYEPMLTKDAYDAIQMAIDALSADGDTISREVAIEALKNDMASIDHIIKGMSANDVRLDAYVSQRNQVNYDIYAIEQLPPAQPAPSQVAKDIARIVENGQDMRVIAQGRIRGHWIPVGGTLYQCDQCGVVSLKRKFCSECGADMREVKE